MWLNSARRQRGSTVCTGFKAALPWETNITVWGLRHLPQTHLQSPRNNAVLPAVPASSGPEQYDAVAASATGLLRPAARDKDPGAGSIVEDDAPAMTWRGPPGTGTTPSSNRGSDSISPYHHPALMECKERKCCWIHRFLILSKVDFFLIEGSITSSSPELQ